MKQNTYSPLLAKILSDPDYELTPHQMIDILRQCTEKNRQMMTKYKNKKIVLIMGGTGEGKSTAVNQILGKKFDFKDSKLLCLDEVAKIGHHASSETFLPQFYSYGDLILCDCPGIKDNRHNLIKICNILNITEMFISFPSICILGVISAASIESLRGEGFRQLINLIQFIVGKNKINESLESIRILITKWEPNRRAQTFSQYVSLISAQIHPILEKNIRNHYLFCDPLQQLLQQGSITVKKFYNILKRTPPLKKEESLNIKAFFDEKDLIFLQKIYKQMEGKVSLTNFTTKEELIALNSQLSVLNDLKLIQNKDLGRYYKCVIELIMNKIENSLIKNSISLARINQLKSNESVNLRNIFINISQILSNCFQLKDKYNKQFLAEYDKKYFLERNKKIQEVMNVKIKEYPFHKIESCCRIHTFVEKCIAEIKKYTKPAYVAYFEVEIKDQIAEKVHEIKQEALEIALKENIESIKSSELKQIYLISSQQLQRIDKKSREEQKEEFCQTFQKCKKSTIMSYCNKFIQNCKIENKEDINQIAEVFKQLGKIQEIFQIDLQEEIDYFRKSILKIVSQVKKTAIILAKSKPKQSREPQLKKKLIQWLWEIQDLEESNETQQKFQKQYNQTRFKYLLQNFQQEVTKKCNLKQPNNKMIKKIRSHCQELVALLDLKYATLIHKSLENIVTPKFREWIIWIFSQYSLSKHEVLMQKVDELKKYYKQLLDDRSPPFSFEYIEKKLLNKRKLHIIRQSTKIPTTFQKLQYNCCLLTGGILKISQIIRSINSEPVVNVILMAYTHIQIDQKFKYNCHLVLIAPEIINNLTTSQVVIDLSGHSGADGRRGRTGIRGQQNDLGLRYGWKGIGGFGGDGGDGINGTPSGSLYIISKKTSIINALLKGGNGGKGGDGGQGGPGQNGKTHYTRFQFINGSEEIDGGRGGKGGKAGYGGQAGQRGQLFKLPKKEIQVQAVIEDGIHGADGEAGQGGSGGCAGQIIGQYQKTLKIGLEGPDGNSGVDIEPRQKHYIAWSRPYQSIWECEQALKPFYRKFTSKYEIPTLKSFL